MERTAGTLYCNFSLHFIIKKKPLAISREGRYALDKMILSLPFGSRIKPEIYFVEFHSKRKGKRFFGIPITNDYKYYE
jgi:hypothetical protein